MADDTDLTLIEAMLEGMTEGIAEIRGVVDQIALDMESVKKAYFDLELSKITGDSSDHSNRLPAQPTELPADGVPVCRLHGTQMLERQSKKGGYYWHCPTKGGDGPQNDAGYCRLMAFINDDNTVRYWQPPNE